MRARERRLSLKPIINETYSLSALKSTLRRLYSRDSFYFERRHSARNTQQENGALTTRQRPSAIKRHDNAGARNDRAAVG